MGFYFGDCTDITLRNTKIIRRPGLPMSITADASHFSQCMGLVQLQHCHFEGQGDDGLNIHGVFHDVRSLDSATGTFMLGSRPAGGVSELNVGERYQFRNRSTWAVEDEATLTSVKMVNNLQQAAFSDFAHGGSGISRFALLANVQRQPAVHVAYNYFGNNRARGSLIKTSNVLVEGNFYDHPAGIFSSAFHKAPA